MIDNAALCPCGHPLLGSARPDITLRASEAWLLETLASAGLAHLASTLTEHERAAHLAAVRRLQTALVSRANPAGGEEREHDA